MVIDDDARARQEKEDEALAKAIAASLDDTQRTKPINSKKNNNNDCVLS